MDLFGPRDEDPLLRNDPLAPSDSEGDRAERPDDPDPDDASRPGASDAEAPPPDDRAPENRSRRVAYSREEAAEGPLPTLNRALGQGWRLARVRLRDNEAFVFTLRRA